MSEEVKTNRRLSVICFIISILGFLTGIIGIGILLDVIAITLGVVAIASAKQRNWLSISGLSISSCGLILMALFIVFVVNGDTVEKTTTAQTENIEVAEELEVKTEDIEKVVETEEIEVAEETIEDDQEVGEMQNTETAPIETEEIEIETETEVEEELTDYSKLSEEEYKELCSEMYYDDLLFSDENLTGTLVKVKMLLGEKMFFKAESMYNLFFVDLQQEYSLKRDFYRAFADRKDEDSYMGYNINLLFTENNVYDASDFEVGNYVIVYGEIINYSVDDWDGFNECYILPNYIELSEK